MEPSACAPPLVVVGLPEVEVLPSELMLHVRLSLVAGAPVHVGLDNALLVLVTILI